MRTISVLVIDDDPNIRKLLLELLSGRKEYRVLVAGDGKEAVRFFVEEKIDVVLTDIHMPGFTGLELMADMKKVKFRPEILVMTANATPENVETARQVGARSVILKPFDNLDVVEAEIEKAARAVLESAQKDAPERGKPAAAVAPAPRPAPGGPQAPVGIPDIDAWQVDLVANQTPPPGPAAARTAATGRPAAAAPGQVKRDAETNRRAADPPARRVPRTPPATRPPAPVAAEPPAIGEPAAAAPGEPAPEMPPDLDDIFRMVGSLDVGKMQMQVPIVCLQTWEEKAAVAALRLKASALQREIYVWSAARGIVKEDGQTLGEVYRDPSRALEFIRRQKAPGLYVLADFRQCLEDQTVVRVLREMVMDTETGRALLVLTAPRLPIPPELQPACAVFDWPAGGGADLESLYEEVIAELAASSGRAIRMDRASKEALLARLREIPAGRARFEIARALMALTKKAS